MSVATRCDAWFVACLLHTSTICTAGTAAGATHGSLPNSARVPGGTFSFLFYQELWSAQACLPSSSEALESRDHWHIAFDAMVYNCVLWTCLQCDVRKFRWCTDGRTQVCRRAKRIQCISGLLACSWPLSQTLGDNLSLARAVLRVLANLQSRGASHFLSLWRFSDSGALSIRTSQHDLECRGAALKLNTYNRTTTQAMRIRLPSDAIQRKAHRWRHACRRNTSAAPCAILPAPNTASPAR